MNEEIIKSINEILLKSTIEYRPQTDGSYQISWMDINGRHLMTYNSTFMWLAVSYKRMWLPLVNLYDELKLESLIKKRMKFHYKIDIFGIWMMHRNTPS